MSQIEVDRAATGMAVEFTPGNALTSTKDIDSGFKQRVRGFFDALADYRAGYRNRNHYYHEQ
ncbi:MAG: hypothetical protein IH830_09405 [Planctomycetes bacterium]|nr:hypothetical protein [Planctomycetota bacterium]